MKSVLVDGVQRSVPTPRKSAAALQAACPEVPEHRHIMLPYTSMVECFKITALLSALVPRF